MFYNGYMNKKLMIIITVVVLAIASGFTYLLFREKPVETVSVDKTSDMPAPTPQTPEPVAQSTPGAYVAYSPEAVNSAKGTKILFFHAAWCPQCRQLDAQITTGPLPDNVTIFKVDYDTNQALRQKYGVQLQTTLVKVDDNGNLIQKFVAYDRPTLASLIENML